MCRFKFTTQVVVWVLFLMAFCAVAMAGDLPDPKLTPGVVRTTDAKDVCSGVSTKEYRHTSTATKLAVYKAYGILPHMDYCSGSEGCEIDHLISLELGGADEQANLWPQAYQGDHNAHQKDALENTLHKLVCAGTITLDEAQTAIRTDWIAAYQKYVTPSK